VHHIKHLFRKIFVGIAGTLLIILGVLLLVLPGPGLLVIALGLFVLSLEFAWADKYFQKLKTEADKYSGRLQKYIQRLFK